MYPKHYARDRLNHRCIKKIVINGSNDVHITTPHQKFETNIPRNETPGLVPNFCIHVSVSDFYINGLPILLYCICGPIMGIYKSLTHMYKLGMRPHSFISGNICFEVLVQCRCSAGARGKIIHKKPDVKSLVMLSL